MWRASAGGAGALTTVLVRLIRDRPLPYTGTRHRTVNA
jgi:hypothetical protein